MQAAAKILWQRQEDKIHSKAIMIRQKIFLTCVALVFCGTLLSLLTTGQYAFVPINQNALAASVQQRTDDAAVKVYDGRPDLLIEAQMAAPAPTLPATMGVWINSAPLALENLRGRVVLLDFWSYRCPYCRNALPELNRLNARYNKRGLTLIGIHSPMLESDKVTANVRAQVSALGVLYPVVTDRGHLAWDAFEMEAWPTVVLLDKQGRIRFTHVGEGAYKETENAIKKLLAE